MSGDDTLIAYVRVPLHIDMETDMVPQLEEHGIVAYFSSDCPVFSRDPQWQCLHLHGSPAKVSLIVQMLEEDLGVEHRYEDSTGIRPEGWCPTPARSSQQMTKAEGKRGAVAIATNQAASRPSAGRGAGSSSGSGFGALTVEDEDEADSDLVGRGKGVALTRAPGKGRGAPTTGRGRGVLASLLASGEEDKTTAMRVTAENTRQPSAGKAMNNAEDKVLRDMPSEIPPNIRVELARLQAAVDRGDAAEQASAKAAMNKLIGKLPVDERKQKVAMIQSVAMGIMSKKATAKSEEEKVAKGPSLRFALGDRVECKVGDNKWIPGEVVQLWYEEEGMAEPAPYQVLLDDGFHIYAPVDNDSHVRKDALSLLLERALTRATFLIRSGSDDVVNQVLKNEVFPDYFKPIARNAVEALLLARDGRHDEAGKKLRLPRLTPAAANYVRLKVLPKHLQEVTQATAAGSEQALNSDSLLKKRVKVVDVVKRPELNGLVGEVVLYDKESGRYGVKLEGESVKLKPANLVVVEESVATQEVEPAGSANGESSAEPSAQLSAKQRKKARQKEQRRAGKQEADLDREMATTRQELTPPETAKTPAEVEQESKRASRARELGERVTQERLAPMYRLIDAEDKGEDVKEICKMESERLVGIPLAAGQQLILAAARKDAYWCLTLCYYVADRWIPSFATVEAEDRNRFMRKVGYAAAEAKQTRQLQLHFDIGAPLDKRILEAMIASPAELLLPVLGHMRKRPQMKRGEDSNAFKVLCTTCIRAYGTCIRNVKRDRSMPPPQTF